MVKVKGYAIKAMCILDALSVAPKFEVATRIKSSCAVSSDPVMIPMHGQMVETLDTPAELCVGIRWQFPCGAAASYRLFCDMVFQVGAGDGR